QVRAALAACDGVTRGRHFAEELRAQALRHWIELLGRFIDWGEVDGLISGCAACLAGGAQNEGDRQMLAAARSDPATQSFVLHELARLLGVIGRPLEGIPLLEQL